MPKRRYREVTELVTGIRFRFAYDAVNPMRLHIEARHDVTVEDAIRTYLERRTTVWNEVNKRWESESNTHVLYWALHASSAVLVITCFRKEE